jgi:ABC-type sulfate transport system substrate-binding protein
MVKDRLCNLPVRRHWRFLLGVGFILLVLALVTYYGGQVLTVNALHSDRLIVYAFSTQEEVLSQGILPAFKESWVRNTGKDLEIEAVYGPSATLAGQINLGAPAEVAFFSNAHQVDCLKVGRMIRQETQPKIIGYTPLIIVTRLGNPFDITSYSDLALDGVHLIHADPRSSGAGEWSILAEYGSALLELDDPTAARNLVKDVWHNVRLLGLSARSSLTLFELGAGDALITYEQDARLALERGVPLQIVIPKSTILAQHVAVVVDENVSSFERPLVQAFMDFLSSEDAQKVLNRYHMRPVNLNYTGFPSLNQTFTVEDLGGWSQAYHQLVETFWHSEIESGLDLDLVPGFINPEG